MITVHKIDPLRDSRWQQLVDRHPQASVFHTTAWLEALHRTYGYRPTVFTTSSPTGELKNGLIFCRIRSWLTGPRMVSLPFSDHCEPLFESQEEFSFVLNCLQAEMEHLDWKYLEVRPINGRFDRIGSTDGFSAANLYYLHRLDLRPDLGDIFQSFDKDSVQRRVRRAERAGLVYECGRSDRLLQDFYRMLLLTRDRHELPPQPYAWFQNLLDSMGSALEIRAAYKEGQPIAAILTLRFRDIVYYKYGGSDANFKNLGAMSLLLWRAILESKVTGAIEFDFGRSDIDQKGLVRFKDHWADGRTQMVYWRFPASGSLAVKEAWKLKLAKCVFACMPRGLLARTGKLIYPHIG